MENSNLCFILFHWISNKQPHSADCSRRFRSFSYWLVVKTRMLSPNEASKSGADQIHHFAVKNVMFDVLVSAE